MTTHQKTHLDDATREGLELYLEGWKSLSDREKEIYVQSRIFSRSSGEIGKMFGATDIRDHYLDGCWNATGEPVNFPESEQIWNLEQDIKKRLYEKTKAVRSHDGSKYHVNFAFHWMVQDILFGNGGEHEMEYPCTKAGSERWDREERERSKDEAKLFLDFPKLEKLTKDWLDKNRPIPKKSQKKGNQ